LDYGIKASIKQYEGGYYDYEDEEGIALFMFVHYDDEFYGVQNWSVLYRYR
jgi:hypothetical protein